MRLEAASSEGRRNDTNLDRWVVVDGYAAVLDGATPKHPDLAGATQATDALMDDLVSTISSLPAAASQAEILNALTATALGHRHPYLPSATGAIYSAYLHQVLVIGDTWVSIDGDATFYGHAYESLTAAIRVALTECELAQGADPAQLRENDPGRAAIADLLAAEERLRNVDADGRYFFAAVDGRPIPDRLVRSIDVPRSARSLVLASDGYPALPPTLAEAEEALARVVREDPLMISSAPATKAVADGAAGYDDRTFVALDLD